MHYNENTNRWRINATMPEELGENVLKALSDDPELTESRLVREGIRRELQQREHTDE